MFLSACGGGGGGSSATDTAGNPATGSNTSTGGSNTSTATVVTADTRAEANKQYQVNAAGPVTITLPTSIAVGDTITVTGASNTAWTIGQNDGQTVVTTALPGNTATGQSWTPHLTSLPWWWIASNVAGDVRVGALNIGGLQVSTDGGQTWNETLTVRQNWISVDMTPTGDRMVAVGYGGTMYMSNDRGATWTQVASAGTGPRDWESVAISDDGQRIVASVQNGPIYVSSNGGATWTATTPTRWWRTVSMSANGSVVLGLEQNGSLWRSTDGGMTWTDLNRVGDWYRTDMSADGQVMVVAEMNGGNLFVSRDSGTTWTPARDVGGTALQGRWTNVSVSRDGQRIAVSASGYGGHPGGGVYLSDNGGTSFTALTMPGTDNNWRAMAMSGDGNMLTAATGNNFDNFSGTGQLYTSSSNRTSTGALGSLVGGQGQTLQLRYVGDGRFEATSTGGGSYTIR